MRRRCAVALIVLFGVLLPARAANAATLIVTTTLDTYDGACDQQCSLRDALFIAAQGSNPMIKLPAGVITLTLAGIGNHDSGDLDVGGSTIIGKGATQTVIRGGGDWADRIFEIHGAVTLRDLTVSGGNVPDTGGLFADNGGGIRVTGGSLDLQDSVVEDNDGPDQGGGIFSDGGPVTLTRSRVSDNRSSGTQGRGAGIFIGGTGPLNIVDSVVSNNVANCCGGGVWVSSFSTITDSVITGNTADLGGGIYYNTGVQTDIVGSTISNNVANNGGGAGMYLQAASLSVYESTISHNSGGSGISVGPGGSASLFLQRSTVSHNISPSLGGGVDVSGSATITDSTLSANETGGDGGGVRVGQDAFADIQRTTIANNVANRDADATGDGGGFSIASVLGSLSLATSIVSGNQDLGTGTIHENCSNIGTLTTNGTNVVPNKDDCGTALAADDDADPLLGPLDFNGGPTATHAIPANSPAADVLAGDAPGCQATTDQRGVPRPVGAGCDAGAYEYAECLDTVVNVVGTANADTLEGTNGNDGVLAFEGDDVISTLEGDDRVCAGAGKDTVNGGDGADQIAGEDDNDKLFGDAGIDHLDGGAGRRDRCTGGTEKDTFAGCERKKQ